MIHDSIHRLTLKRHKWFVYLGRARAENGFEPCEIGGIPEEFSDGVGLPLLQLPLGGDISFIMSDLFA